MQKHLGKAKRMGRPSKATLQEYQQVNVRIDRTKYRDLRSNLAKHGVTVVSFILSSIDDYLNDKTPSR